MAPPPEQQGVSPRGASIVLAIVIHDAYFARSRWTGWDSTSTHHNLYHRDFEGNYGLYWVH